MPYLREDEDYWGFMGRQPGYQGDMTSTDPGAVEGLLSHAGGKNDQFMDAQARQWFDQKLTDWQRNGGQGEAPDWDSFLAADRASRGRPGSTAPETPRPEGGTIYQPGGGGPGGGGGGGGGGGWPVPNWGDPYAPPPPNFGPRDPWYNEPPSVITDRPGFQHRDPSGPSISMYPGTGIREPAAFTDPGQFTGRFPGPQYLTESLEGLFPWSVRRSPRGLFSFDSWGEEEE